MVKLHEDEVDIDDDLVHALVAAQFPQWSDAPIERVPSTGTVNAIYRLGDALSVRLPRRAKFVRDLETELTWLPQLAPHLSLRIPQPVARGETTDAFPYTWAIYRWLDGEALRTARPGDVDALAQFVSELRGIDTGGAPRSGRVFHLGLLGPGARAAIESLDGTIDMGAAMAAWETSLAEPEWDGAGLWTHGDLLRPNLLTTNGQLSAVIDFGCVGIGDPAFDVIPAWSVFDGDAREAFRAALDVDDATWIRARGYALNQALLIIPYYRQTNPAFAEMATRTVEQVILDHG